MAIGLIWRLQFCLSKISKSLILVSYGQHNSAVWNNQYDKSEKHSQRYLLALLLDKSRKFRFHKKCQQEPFRAWGYEWLELQLVESDLLKAL